ncbi:hypothetical protein ACUXV3_09945 [Roseobacteraceae bacterium NS-SX3]
MKDQAASLPPEWRHLGFRPGAALRLFGMRRSGNHAIADWLQRNAPGGRSVFLNNCKPGSSPFDAFRGIEVNGRRAPQKAAGRDMAQVVAEAGEGALFLVSYEDTSPSDFLGRGPVSGSFDEGLFTADILLCRSFLNWCASLLKKLQGNPDYSLARRSAVLLRAIDTYTRLLALAGQADELALTCIRYDDWMADAGYRAGVLARLGLPAGDNTLGAVQPYGGGSSFQNDAQSAADLETGSRWRQMAADPEYQAVLHLAARDMALMAQLEQHFPQDAARLARIAERNVLAAEAFA